MLRREEDISYEREGTGGATVDGVAEVVALIAEAGAAAEVLATIDTSIARIRDGAPEPVDVLSHGLGGDGAMPRESMNSPRRSASLMVIVVQPLDPKFLGNFRMGSCSLEMVFNGQRTLFKAEENCKGI